MVKEGASEDRQCLLGAASCQWVLHLYQIQDLCLDFRRHNLDGDNHFSCRSISQWYDTEVEAIDEKRLGGSEKS